MPEPGTSTYVFGPICDRADCNHVKQALSPRYRMFWFMASLPEENYGGRPASFRMNGEPNDLDVMWGMSYERKRRADRRVKKEVAP